MRIDVNEVRVLLNAYESSYDEAIKNKILSIVRGMVNPPRKSRSKKMDRVMAVTRQAYENEGKIAAIKAYRNEFKERPGLKECKDQVELWAANGNWTDGWKYRGPNFS